MAKEEIQFDILKTEFELCQQQMDKYDQLSMTTKTWAITLWAASMGWAFQVNRSEVILLNILILVLFWFFDALNKTFRTDYKKRRDEAATALEYLFRTGVLPQNTTSPQLPEHRSKDTLQNIFAVHIIAVPYFILALVSFALYIKF